MIKTTLKYDIFKSERPNIYLILNDKNMFEIDFINDKITTTCVIWAWVESLTESKLQHSCSVDIFYNDELDFLEVQRINNIMRAAYKEFMEIAIKTKAWTFDPPPVGSVEDLQEMFHTPPPHGSTVECSVESAMLSISSRSLISIMMNGVSYPQSDIGFQFSLFVSLAGLEMIKPKTYIM